VESVRNKTTRDKVKQELVSAKTIINHFI